MSVESEFPSSCIRICAGVILLVNCPFNNISALSKLCVQGWGGGEIGVMGEIQDEGIHGII